MSNFMVAIGILVAIRPPTDIHKINAYGVAAVAAVYLEAFSSNWS